MGCFLTPKQHLLGTGFKTQPVWTARLCWVLVIAELTWASSRHTAPSSLHGSDRRGPAFLPSELSLVSSPLCLDRNLSHRPQVQITAHTPCQPGTLPISCVFPSHFHPPSLPSLTRTHPLSSYVTLTPAAWASSLCQTFPSSSQANSFRLALGHGPLSRSHPQATPTLDTATSPVRDTRKAAPGFA